ncbi:uncharacterized protein ATNIH1004_007178 [Aspergillus tanneri]|uniref:Uncharacterized protein n=1 Tax=Aspergillus tanneri TaxID=1220188 RepID=A0A5M9MMR8_9EURO|nr:uncharacterized protein ATNIH1004_007178 [Aspergillus tanneri]KAA8645759.1 hypothetical protein ATNIH1004_007178 [Aspergillus tanneri]
MPNLNKFYDRYLRDRATGTLAAAAANSEYKFSSTNNPCHHLAKYHAGYYFTQVTGGRASLAVRSQANYFYESLYVYSNLSSSSEEHEDEDDEDDNDIYGYYDG